MDEPESLSSVRKQEIHKERINCIIQGNFNNTDSKDDLYQLKNCRLSTKAKLAHYRTPDYCFVTRADTLNILLLELEPLVQQEGIYYGIYDKIQNAEDFTKKR